MPQFFNKGILQKEMNTVFNGSLRLLAYYFQKENIIVMCQIVKLSTNTTFLLHFIPVPALKVADR